MKNYLKGGGEIRMGDETHTFIASTSLLNYTSINGCHKYALCNMGIITKILKEHWGLSLQFMVE